MGGWGGDVALLGEGTKPFLAGTGSFALGHAAYLTGFLRQHGDSSVRHATGPRAVAGSWALTAPVMAAMARRRNRELGGPVLGYATMLAAMAAAANYLDTDLPPAARRLTAAGAGLFMLSDTLLGFRKFVLSDPPPALETGVMATYTAAQFLLSEGAAQGLSASRDIRVGWDRRTVPPHFFPRGDDPGRMSRRHVVSRRRAPAFPQAASAQPRGTASFWPSAIWPPGSELSCWMRSTISRTSPGSARSPAMP